MIDMNIFIWQASSSDNVLDLRIVPNTSSVHPSLSDAVTFVIHTLFLFHSCGNILSVNIPIGFFDTIVKTVKLHLPDISKFYVLTFFQFLMTFDFPLWIINFSLITTLETDLKFWPIGI